MARSPLHEEVTWGRRSRGIWAGRGAHRDTFSVGFLRPGSATSSRGCFEQLQLFFQAVGALMSLEIRPWLILGWFPFSAVPH